MVVRDRPSFCIGVLPTQPNLLKRGGASFRCWSDPGQVAAPAWLCIFPIGKVVFCIANQRTKLVVSRPLVFQAPAAQGCETDSRARRNLVFSQESCTHECSPFIGQERSPCTGRRLTTCIRALQIRAMMVGLLFLSPMKIQESVIPFGNNGAFAIPHFGRYE